MATKDWTKSVIANDVIDLANDNARASYELLLLTDKTAIARTLERIEKNKIVITSKLEQLDGLLYLAEARPSWPPSGKHANPTSHRLPKYPNYCWRKENVKRRRVS